MIRRMIPVVLAAVLAGCAKPPVATTATAATPKPTPLPALAPIDFPPPPPGMEVATRANALGVEGKCGDALPLFEEGWNGGVRHAGVLYNAACCFAREGKLDLAMTWFERAADAGWRDADHAMKDPDLEPIRGRPRFAELIAAIRARPPEVDPELARIRGEDQRDRSGEGPMKDGALDWKLVKERDDARLKRVKELIAEGRLKTGEDYWSAALVCQHSLSLADYELARSLAYEAAKRGHRGGVWLTAAAWDRWLVTAGYPQKFGTQFFCPERKCRPEPIDPATTDEMRRQWDVPDPEEHVERIQKKYE